jgi:integrase
MSRPWWRKTNNAWYATIGGKQELLCKAPSKSDRKGRDRADKELQKKLALKQSLGYNATVVGVLEEFLTTSKKNQAQGTYYGHKLYLQDFLDHLEFAFVRELKPIHLTKWIDGHETWGNASKRAAIISVKRAFNWAVEQGLIEKNPFGTVKRPPPGRREVLVADESHKKVLRATDRAFRRVVRVMRATGCRPIEVRLVTASDVNLEIGAWVFPVGHPANKTGRKTQRLRITYFPPSIIRLIKALMKRYPTGPLFRNREGNPWNCNAIRLRWRRLRQKLGLPAGTCSYAYRHTFTTEGLERGVPVATMAELLGHQDLGMISRHYGHLAQKSQHLRAAAEQAGEVRSSDGKS